MVMGPAPPSGPPSGPPAGFRPPQRSGGIPGTVIAAIVCMWINAGAGIILGLAFLDEAGGAAGLGIVLGVIWAVIAVATARLRPGARTAALAFAGIAMIMSLASGRIEFGTTLAVFILMLTPSARAAFVGSV